jgi:lipid A 3-O-deacylase
MRLFFGLIFSASLFLPATIFPQAIDNTVSFRNINAGKYTRIFYENDFFTGTDRDYTQGIYIERVTPSLSHFLLSKLLWHPKNDNIKYGIAIEDDGYTPNIIDKSAIQYGDRPYAGVLFIKTFVTATNTRKRERFSTLLSTGIIGQSAGGAPMQKAIHHWIHYTQPLGWPNQIRNDVVLNYQINFEKELVHYNNNFSLVSYNSARIGTLSTKVSTGINAMIGNFYSSFDDNNNVHHKKIQYYFYDQPSINFVGYDATLQGGLFNHTSPYTIAGKDITRINLMNRWGFVLIFKSLYLEYFQSCNTPEFTPLIAHRSGGLQIGFGF